MTLMKTGGEQALGERQSSLQGVLGAPLNLQPLRNPTVRQRPYAPSSSTMITTPAYYLVAYPHSTIHPTKRIKRFKLDPDAVGKDLLGLLKDAYPEHSGDLDDVTLWKVSRLFRAQIPP